MISKSETPPGHWNTLANSVADAAGFEPRWRGQGDPLDPLAWEWATYYDAADQAGQSRLYGGIHITPDDFVGREFGSLVGLDAVAHAETYFRPPDRTE